MWYISYLLKRNLSWNTSIFTLLVLPFGRKLSSLALVDYLLVDWLETENSGYYIEAPTSALDEFEFMSNLEGFYLRFFDTYASFIHASFTMLRKHFCENCNISLFFLSFIFFFCTDCIIQRQWNTVGHFCSYISESLCSFF